jgi:dTDP-4-dehydrorhamnose reductase
MMRIISVQLELKYSTNENNLKDLDCTFVKGDISDYVSTDYVFSGDNGIYKEENKPKFELDKDLIKSSRMEELNWLAKRPEDSSLDTSKVVGYLKEKTFGLDMALEILVGELKDKGG